MSRRQRYLTEEEKLLWAKVKKTAQPLTDIRGTQRQTDTDTRSPKPSGKIDAPKPGAQTHPPAPRKPVILKPHGSGSLGPIITAQQTPALNKIEKSTARKIASGRTTIDRKVDLHGLTQAEAHYELNRIITSAWYADLRTLLIITGKGKGEGILRQAVPRWLAEPDFRPYISGVDQAHLTHGGQGAIYVRLKRRKSTT